MMGGKSYTGLLTMRPYGEAEDILCLSSSLTGEAGAPLADELGWMTDRQVTVRYWITDKKATKEEAQEGFINKLIGKADVEFGSAYSEITGYLWTDEELSVGGHDLMAELRSHVGKWLILEVDTENE